MPDNDLKLDGFSCPLPILNYDTIQLAHGSGGRLTAELIDKVFLPCFSNDTLDKLEDQAVLKEIKGKPVLTTDSFVVSPIFFPGGDIGDLAINGTVNDIVMSGAKALYLTAAFILEEGFSIDSLHEIVVSMRRAADKAGVIIVTGDTKVVNKGSCDKIFINTTGFGELSPGVNISVTNLKAGDKIIISGTIADHGMAVMTKRERLSFHSDINSDSAALNGLVTDMLDFSMEIHAMRDPTRGGVATTLNEMAKGSSVGIRIFEEMLPVRDNVRGACEILGIDPLYVANEGKLIAVVPGEITDGMIEVMRKNELGQDAKIIAEVIDEHPGVVTLKNVLGVERVVDIPLGEQLPRIC